MVTPGISAFEGSCTMPPIEPVTFWPKAVLSMMTNQRHMELITVFRITPPNEAQMELRAVKKCCRQLGPYFPDRDFFDDIRGEDLLKRHPATFAGAVSLKKNETTAPRVTPTSGIQRMCWMP